MLNVLPLIEEPEWFKNITQENIETHDFDIFKVHNIEGSKSLKKLKLDLITNN
jgi:hypothetical protein